jgi:hypothetical protein
VSSAAAGKVSVVVETVLTNSSLRRWNKTSTLVAPNLTPFTENVPGLGTICIRYATSIQLGWFLLLACIERTRSPPDNGLSNSH